MANYEMQESNLPNEEGRKVLFPRMVIRHQVGLDAIARTVSYASTFTPGDIKGLVIALADEMARLMGEGNSVKIDGIGTFTPSLGLREGVERESGEEGDSRRNAASICVDNIHFRAEKDFVAKTGMNCDLQRSKGKFRRSSQHFSPQERLQRALDFLDTHPFLTVADYCKLTGLLRDTAARELRRWREDPETDIHSVGRGSHKVHVKRDGK